jgi:hypothetical protein
VTGLSLSEKIEKAFAHRKMPSNVIEPEQFLQFDSDVEDALTFTGKDWHEITCEHWRKHYCAVSFLSPEAFAYYLPSLMSLTITNPENYPDLAVDSLINELDRSPSTVGLYDPLLKQFNGINSEEFDVIKEWLLYMCENSPYNGLGNKSSGPGEIYGRAFDTLDILQKETEIQKL